MVSETRSLSLRRVHGAHNAFYLLDARGRTELAGLDFARVASSAAALPGPYDGLLVVLDDAVARARMRMFNPDASEAEMCGNGMRCVARHLVADGAPDRFAVASAAGPVACEVVRHEPFEVRLGLGAVSVSECDDRLAAFGQEIVYRFASLGNPHAVVPLALASDVEALDLQALAAAFAADPRFAGGVNLHAMAKTGGRSIVVRHFERGAGETRACGTGAVASAAVAIARGLVRSPVVVEVPGGTLTVTWAPGDIATLAGPAVDEGSATLSLVSA